jgi:SAM-dependent methyltransferase
MGQVFEHVLEHPIRLLSEITRVLTPGGILVLTTPNPSTAINAVRVMLDRRTLWRTHDFMCSVRVRDGKVVFGGGIHDREYRRNEIVEALGETGYSLVKAGYRAMGSSSSQPLLKRAIKTVAAGTILRSRLFGSSHYIVARRT